MTNQSTWGCRCPTGIQVAPDGGRILQGCSRINESANHKKHSPVDHVVDMDLGGDGLRGAHHQDGRAPQLRNVSVPQSVCHVAHPFLKPLLLLSIHISIKMLDHGWNGELLLTTQSKSLQLPTDPVEEM